MYIYIYIYILITPRGDQGYICILNTHPGVIRELAGAGIYIYIYIYIYIVHP